MATNQNATKISSSKLVTKRAFEVQTNKANKMTKQLDHRIKKWSTVTEIMKWSNATPFQSFGSTGYKCCYCANDFRDAAQLKQHTIDIHAVDDIPRFPKRCDMTRFYVKMDITELRCKICSKNIDTIDRLMQHLLIDHEKKIFTDEPSCIVPFKFKNNALQCFICFHKFYAFKTLLEHMNRHCRNFVCKHCDSGFITSAAMKMHLKTHQTGKYKCDVCKKVFATTGTRKYHIRHIHGCVKHNKCSYCNESFRDYNQKLRHLLKVHNIAPAKVKCEACDRSFTRQKALTQHMRRHHLMERTIRCTRCEMAFYTTQELQDHMVKHTGVKAFQCDVCKKSYVRKWTLREHMRIHADDRRFKCKHCGVAFVQKCSWRGHMRMKHGEHV